MKPDIDLRNTRFPFVLVTLLLICSILIATSLFWSDNATRAQGLSLSCGYPNNLENESILSRDLYVPDLFDKVKASIVKVSPSSLSENASELGTGFVYDKNGHVLTNSHVVGTASAVVLTFNDGNQYNANVTGKDHLNDIAVLKISENITEPLKPVEFGNSSAVRVGQRVLAIGNPYGFANTLTMGVISQIGRLLPEAGNPVPLPNMIQTDATINPGNSGGPLINLEGCVIGMNSATFQSQLGGSTDLGFAIPTKTLQRVVPVLIDNGSYNHSMLGISAITLTSDLRESIGLSPNFKGVLVNSVVKDGPANKAGIQESTLDQSSQSHGWDIITAIDGVPITDTNGLLSYIEDNKSVGDRVKITIYRNNQTIILPVVLEERTVSSNALF